MSSTVSDSQSATSTTSRETRYRVVAAILLIVAVVQYWVLEGVAAAAWVSPPYRYYYNFVSDLGVEQPNVVFQGRHATSPMHDVANTTFGILGVLVATALVLLALTVQRRGLRTTLIALGVVFGVGSLLVASFPENTIQLLHLIGAFFNIWGGLAIIIVIGFFGRRFAIHRGVTVVLVALGAIGFVASLGLIFVPGMSNGGVERVSAYSYMIGFAVIGIATLLGPRRHRKSAIIT